MLTYTDAVNEQLTFAAYKTEWWCTRAREDIRKMGDQVSDLSSCAKINAEGGTVISAPKRR